MSSLNLTISKRDGLHWAILYVKAIGVKVFHSSKRVKKLDRPWKGILELSGAPTLLRADNQHTDGEDDQSE